MRRRVSGYAAAVLAALLVAGSSVQADPIPITITTEFSAPEASVGNGSFELFGTGGFSFIGGFGGSNISPPCCVEPGETWSIGQSASGLDVGGTVTYAGDTYTHLGETNSANHADLTFVTNRFVVPAGGRPVTVIVEPFTLTGVFTGRPGDLWNEGLPGPEPQRFTLTGHGTARLPLTWSGEGFWNVGLPRFDFASPAPTPEPTSLLLLAAGIAGVGAVRRRRDKATQ